MQKPSCAYVRHTSSIRFWSGPAKKPKSKLIYKHCFSWAVIEISSTAMWTKWFQHPSELWFYILELVVG